MSVTDGLSRQLTQKVTGFLRKSRYERLAAVRRYFGNRDWRTPRKGNDKTVYIIGLFGTGRLYLVDIVLRNVGSRAKYFRDKISCHAGPTSMIYSGHATIKHISALQVLPEETSRLLNCVRLGFAELIFVYRHPLDSLLTNWVWWRTYLRDGLRVTGISEAYKSRTDLCADLEQYFSEFESFAHGNPDFFTGFPGPRFLSFVEFVEETELFLRSATLALRLEDFVIDPIKEFSKVAQIMSVDLDFTRLRIAPPRSRPYGYLVAKDNIPRFRKFINDLDEETKRRIEEMGYDIGVK